MARATKTYEYDYGVYIGRFQPLHDGHVETIRYALARCRTLIIILGSSYAPRSLKNPFTAHERVEMIYSVFPQEAHRLAISAVGDRPYDEAEWLMSVHKTVDMVVSQEPRIGSSKIALISPKKDASTYYLESFPDWDTLPVNIQRRRTGHSKPVSATDIRENMYRNGCVSASVPLQVTPHVEKFMRTGPFKDLREEHAFILGYKADWASSPFPPTFNTVDFMYVDDGHVLLIKRKDNPGRGLWALPGGFLDQSETLWQSATRELKEETGVTVSENDLPIGSHLYDDPARSGRGRILTEVFLYTGNGRPRPECVAGDDAAEAAWVPIKDIHPKDMFSDHFHIIKDMLQRFPLSPSTTGLSIEKFAA